MTEDAITRDTLFPWAWEGPVNPQYLHECNLCGAAVNDQDKHVAWHRTIQ